MPRSVVALTHKYIKCERRERSKTSFLQDNKHCQIWQGFGTPFCVSIQVCLASLKKSGKIINGIFEMNTYICQPYFENRSEHVEKLGQKCKILALLGQ